MGRFSRARKKKTNILMKEIVSEFFHVEKIAGNYFSFKKESIPRIAKKKNRFFKNNFSLQNHFSFFDKKNGKNLPWLRGGLLTL